MTPIYRHTQVSRWTLGLAGAVVIGGVFMGLRAASPGPVVVFGAVGGAMLMFSVLTVTVRAEAVSVSFGLGLVQREIPLRKIRAARAARNAWYYGWGIRMTPSGWLWNVSGLGAVELQIENAGRFRIGTDEPDALVAALLRENQAA